MISEGLIRDGLASSVLIKPLRVIFIAIRSDDAPGDGSRENPHRGNTAEEFDQVMFELNPNTLVVLGPGLFRTAGYQAWTITSGSSIIGSGIFNTTLRFVIEAPGTGRFGGHAIQGPDSFGTVLDTNGVSVMDLTIDCNLSGQLPYTGQEYPKVAVGAIQVAGSNIRVQRVRVINFGTRTPIIDAGVDKSHDSFEDFPIFTTFNNQSMAGKFLPATYGSPTRQTPDLVTDARDWMLGI